jgi:hypothetical protein
MTGLVPVIHVAARSALRSCAAPVPPGPIALFPGANSLDVGVDGRDKPGHDGEGAAFDPPAWELPTFREKWPLGVGQRERGIGG